MFPTITYVNFLAFTEGMSECDDYEKEIQVILSCTLEILMPMYRGNCTLTLAVYDVFVFRFITLR